MHPLPLYYQLGLYTAPPPPIPAPVDPYDITIGFVEEVEARMALMGWDREEAAYHVLIERRARTARRYALDLATPPQA